METLRPTFPRTQFDPQKLLPPVGSFLEKVVAKKLAHLDYDAKGRRIITYFPSGHKEIYDDPEEQVRAEFWAKLIEQYHYPANRIGIEIPVPDRTPKDSADLVVFKDDARKDPFIVIECKREKITPAEFTQSIEQAFGNGHAHKFRATYVGVVAGATERYFDCTDKYPILEREANIISDLPVAYGRVPEYKFVRGARRRGGCGAKPKPNGTRPSAF